MIAASLSLVQSGNWLVPAGRGYQPDADFNKGDLIGEEITPCSDSWLQVNVGGKILRIHHEDYYEI